MEREGLFINRIKKYLPYILIIISGIVIAGGSFFYLNKIYGDKAEMKSIPVLAKKIGIHERIRSEDIKIGKIDKNINTSIYIESADKAIGKFVKKEMVEGSYILKEDLIEKSAVENKEYVTIKIDYARSGGASAGDIVDVYRINKGLNEWAMPYDAELIIQNALVIELSDKLGRKCESSGTISLTTSSNIKTEVIKLCVLKGQAAKLVVGSVDENSGLAFVVKSR